MLNDYYYLVLWIVSWFVGWGALYHIPENKRDYIKNYITVSIYFSIVSIIMLYVFRLVISSLITKVLAFFPLLILVLFFIINFLIYFFSNKFLTKPIKFLEKYSNIGYLHLDNRYLISKSFEIFFQEILMISLVFILQAKGFNLLTITAIFAIMFGFGHIPMLKLQKNFFGLLIFIVALSSSFFFPYLVLNFQYGFVYTYILHWLFYTNSGVLFWIAKSPYFQDSVEKVAEQEKKILNKKIKTPRFPKIKIKKRKKTKKKSR